MDPEKLKSLQIEPKAKERSQRPFVMIFLLVAVITGVFAYFAWPRAREKMRLVAGGQFVSDPSKASPSAVNVERAGAKVQAPPPATKAEGVVLTVSGYIVNRERIELSPRYLGVVKWIGVKKGDAVTNGQVVVLLDDAEYKARVLEVEGRLANARAAHEKAKLDYQRIKKLIADRIETPQAEDEARLRVESTAAVITEAQGALELAQTYLQWTVIRSPINGVVVEKLVDGGELVTPQSFGGTRGPSTAVIAVADPKDLQVEIDLNESDLAKVFLNQQCRVSPEAYLDKGYQGHVAEIAPEANRQKGTLQIKVQIHDPDHFLTPELSAKVEFLAKE